MDRKNFFTKNPIFTKKSVFKAKSLILHSFYTVFA